MKYLFFFALAIGAALLVLGVLVSKKKPRDQEGERPTKRKLLTQREEAMFNRLTQAAPHLIVLAQVSFGALLTAKTRTARNTFDRKIADFVLCDQALQPVAVIELDDASHKAKGELDAARDELLSSAGYKVIRYKNVPDIDQIQRDFPRPKGANDANNDELARTSSIHPTSTVLAREAKSESQRTA